MDKVAEALIDAGAAKPKNEVAASLTAYNPSVRERIGNSIYDIARYLSMDSIANRLRNDVETGIDFVPLVGDAIGFDDAMNDFNAGNYGMAAAGLGLTAAGAVPVVGDAVANAGRKGIRVWTGGVGDPIKAAKDKGAWFSEAKDLAHEYAHGGGRVTGAYIQPKNPIEFRHAEQERTIGDFISTALDGAGNDLDVEQLGPIVESLRARYGDEARPLFEYWNNDPEIAGFLRAIGYDSISVAEKGDMKSKTWAALDPSIFRADGAENARIVSDMLASGRANEVTNDMISAADPAELWKLYESGATGVPMPMDQASRMARAQEMGFDTGTPLYHGTSSDIHAFDLSKFGATDEGFAGRGIYTTDIPDLAADYGNNIIPTMRRSKSDYVVNTGTNDSGLGYIDLENRFGLGGPRDFSGEKAAELTRRAQGEGYEGFWINDRLGDETASEVITFDPANIRSQFARFDPRLKHLSHLSAGLAGAVAAGTISLEVANQMQELGQDYQP